MKFLFFHEAKTGTYGSVGLPAVQAAWPLEDQYEWAYDIVAQFMGRHGLTEPQISITEKDMDPNVKSDQANHFSDQRKTDGDRPGILGFHGFFGAGVSHHQDATHRAEPIRGPEDLHAMVMQHQNERNKITVPAENRPTALILWGEEAQLIHDALNAFGAEAVRQGHDAIALRTSHTMNRLRRKFPGLKNGE